MDPKDRGTDGVCEGRFSIDENPDLGQSAGTATADGELGWLGGRCSFSGIMEIWCRAATRKIWKSSPRVIVSMSWLFSEILVF